MLNSFPTMFFVRAVDNSRCVLLVVLDVPKESLIFAVQNRVSYISNKYRSVHV